MFCTKSTKHKNCISNLDNEIKMQYTTVSAKQRMNNYALGVLFLRQKTNNDICEENSQQVTHTGAHRHAHVWNETHALSAQQLSQLGVSCRLAAPVKRSRHVQWISMRNNSFFKIHRFIKKFWLLLICSSISLKMASLIENDGVSASI